MHLTCKTIESEMADEELSLNEDQLLDNFDDANGDGDLLISEVRVLGVVLLLFSVFFQGIFVCFFGIAGAR